MIPVNNKQIDTTVPKLMHTLKHFINQRDGKELFRDIRDDITNTMITCPFHKDGKEKKPSCGINNKAVKGQIWVHCFTCGYKNVLDSFISRVLGFEDSGEEGRKWILSNFEYGVDRKLNIMIVTGGRGSGKTQMAKYLTEGFIREEMLKEYRFTHPYMYKRGLTDELIEKYDIGYDKYNDCVTFPVRDINGICIFLAKRSVNSKFFMLPGNKNKPLYGVYELDYSKPDIYIVESFFNALTLAKWGHNSVALMGTGSNYQYDLINALPFRTIHLCMDGDSAGRIGAKRLLNEIGNHKIVYNHILPEGKDVNDLTEEEFRNIRVELRSVRQKKKEN